MARPDKELLWLRQREQEVVQGEIKVKGSSGVNPMEMEALAFGNGWGASGWQGMMLFELTP